MDESTNIPKLEKIIEEEKQIEELEKKIDSKEERILAKEDQLVQTERKLKLNSGSFSRYQAKLLHSKFLNRLNKHKILYSFITLVSVVLIWYGIQNLLVTIPFIHNPIIAIILGILIVWFIDKELT